MIGMNKDSEYIKHFNKQSEQYLLCRPDYPEELFDYLSQLVKSTSTVWDCGTGTGQAAKSLAKRFATVIATDINAAQLAAAPPIANIEYHCCPAEQTPIKAGSVNLTIIAQALHWFHFDAFYNEVRRVSAPNALIAAWCYSLGYFNISALDEVIKSLYYDILGTKYWPKERSYIDEEYKTIPFPFEKLETPNFSITKKLNFNQLIGYLSTWSAIKEYQKQHQQNPLELIHEKLQSAWGDEESEHTICWPLHCLLGQIKA
jgi:ubiquinone/menaquinone biosynthesis C-methylase UbiE